MSDTTHTPDWNTINTRLREPFDPALISFRPQGKPNAQGKAEILAYIDARDVQDRLDEAVGAGNWSFDWEPLRYTDKGHILLVKANLTVHGVMKSDVGEASTFSPSKGAVSDALKRAAAQWGIARYLYDLPKVWMPVDQYGHIAPALLAQLRAKLPKPGDIKGRAQFDDAGEPDEGNTPQPSQANGNAAKRQPAQPRQPQTTPEPQDDAPIDPVLDERLDAILRHHPDLRKTYEAAKQLGVPDLTGNAFFTRFVAVAKIAKKQDLLDKPITVAHKEKMAAYVATKVAEHKVKALGAGTRDLATVATPGVRP